MKSIAVYCGSNRGFDDIYKSTALYLADLMVERQITLVYGAGSVGLMGDISQRVLEYNGKVIGVIPEFMRELELANLNVSELIWTKDMHERKMLMFEKADAFLAMPGGFGTMDELFEILTWAQLGIHKKPVGLLNVNGYYDHLLIFVKNMSQEGFLKPENQGLFVTDENPKILLDKMMYYEPLSAKKWI